jgi:hypothetical protein
MPFGSAEPRSNRSWLMSLSALILVRAGQSKVVQRPFC